MSHRSSVFIYPPVQRAYPSFLLFSFYNPFTALMCHIAPHSPFTLQYREHFLPSFFFPSTPLLKVICVTSLLVLHLPSSTERMSVFPSFFLYTPFTGYMCHIAPCFLFFQIPLTSSFSPCTLLQFMMCHFAPFLHIPF